MHFIYLFIYFDECHRPSERSGVLEILGPENVEEVRAALLGRERMGPGWCHPQKALRHLLENS